MTDPRDSLLPLDVASSSTILPAVLRRHADAAMAYARASRAPATVRAYATDLRHYESWCRAHGLTALPTQPATLALYLAAHAQDLSVATLQRRLAAIIVANRRAGFGGTELRRDPILADVWSGIRRTRGTLGKGKAPLVTEDVRRLVQTLPDTLAGKRDRGILLTGFAGALRRAELVALDVSDVTLTAQGVLLRIRKGKTDQEGKGQSKAIPYGNDPSTCPVRALKSWLLAARITEGPVFRPVDRFGRIGAKRMTAQVVRLVVRAAVIRAERAAGCSQREAERRADAYAAHSLRSGWVTSAAGAQVPDNAVMAHTGHRHHDTARRYLELGRLWADHPAGRVGL